MSLEGSCRLYIFKLNICSFSFSYHNSSSTIFFFFYLLQESFINLLLLLLFIFLLLPISPLLLPLYFSSFVSCQVYSSEVYSSSSSCSFSSFLFFSLLVSFLFFPLLLLFLCPILLHISILLPPNSSFIFFFSLSFSLFFFLPFYDLSTPRLSPDPRELETRVPVGRHSSLHRRHVLRGLRLRGAPALGGGRRRGDQETMGSHGGGEAPVGPYGEFHHQSTS